MTPSVHTTHSPSLDAGPRTGTPVPIRHGELTTRSAWWFIAATFAVTWGLGILTLLLAETVESVFGPMGYTNPVFVLMVYSPGFVAVLLVWRRRSTAPPRTSPSTRGTASCPPFSRPCSSDRSRSWGGGGWPFFFGVVAISVILTPMVNAARGSLLAAVLFHAQMNGPAWPDAQPWDMLGFVLVALVVVAVNRRTMLTRGAGTTRVLLPGRGEDTP